MLSNWSVGRRVQSIQGCFKKFAPIFFRVSVMSRYAFTSVQKIHWDDKAISVNWSKKASWPHPSHRLRNLCRQMWCLSSNLTVTSRGSAIWSTAHRIWNVYRIYMPTLLLGAILTLFALAKGLGDPKLMTVTTKIMSLWTRQPPNCIVLFVHIFSVNSESGLASKKSGHFTMDGYDFNFFFMLIKAQHYLVNSCSICYLMNA